MTRLNRLVEARDRMAIELEICLTKYVQRATRYLAEHGQETLSVSPRSDSAMDQLLESDITKLRPTIACSVIPFTGSKRTDAIHVLCASLQKLNHQISVEQAKYFQNPTCHSAFVQFQKPIGAQIAAQSLVNAAPDRMTPTICDVDPIDIEWANINVPALWRRLRKIFTGTIVALLGVISASLGRDTIYSVSFIAISTNTE